MELPLPVVAKEMGDRCFGHYYSAQCCCPLTPPNST